MKKRKKIIGIAYSEDTGLVTSSRRAGFTLVEILVVIGIIVIAISLVLPPATKIFTTASDAQARQLFSAMLGAARGKAIENQSYALVHCQIGVDDSCWIAVMVHNQDTNKFEPAEGYLPQQIPGNIAFGEISSKFVNGGNYISDALDSDDELRDFTTFNIIFTPSGALAPSDYTPQIDTDTKIFGGNGATAKQKIWDVPAGLNEPTVKAVTIFPYKSLVAAGNRANWLEENGQFLCINPYTGRLISTK